LQQIRATKNIPVTHSLELCAMTQETVEDFVIYKRKGKEMTRVIITANAPVSRLAVPTPLPVNSTSKQSA
jgi:hypothetical protein